MSRRTLAILTAYDPALPGTRTFYLTSGTAFITTPSETPASQAFDPVLSGGLPVARRIQGVGGGAVRPALGVLEVANGDGAYDAWAGYAWDGRDIVLREGPETGAYPADYPVVFTGTIDRVDLTTASIQIRVRDAVAALDVPLLSETFAGDNVDGVGLEGEAGLAGVLKPRVFGRVSGVPIAPANPAKLIYQVNDGPVDAVLGVSDGPVALGPYAPTDWQTVNATTGGSCGASNGTTLVVGGVNAGNPAIRTTTDGVSYTSIGSLPFVAAGTVVGMAYAPDLGTSGRFVCVTTGGEIAYSDDAGATWTLATAPAAVSYRRVRRCTRRGLFIAVGANGIIHTDADGTGTWTARTSGVGANGLNDVAVDGPRLVAVGDSGSMTTSLDGVTWVSSVRGIRRRRACLYDGSAYYTAGTEERNVYRSLDGLEWTLHTISDDDATFQIFDFAKAAGYVVAVLNFGTGYATSFTREGATWTAVTGDRSGASAVLAPAAIVAHADRFYALMPTGTQRSGAAGTFASLAELEDDTLAPAPGTFKWVSNAAGSYVRLGSIPVNAVTADVRQGATSGDRTAAGLVAQVLTLAGYTSADWSTSDLTALDTADNSPLGLYLDDETTVADAVDRIARTVGAWWGVDAAGLFRVQQLTAPSGSPTFTITANDIVLRSFERVASDDPLLGRPSYRTTLRYALDDTLALDGVAVAESLAVLTTHALAQATDEETLYTDGTDAADEAARRQTLRGVQRVAYRVTVRLADYHTVDLGAVGTLSHPRFGLSGGVLVRVVAVEPDPAQRQVSFTLWR